MADHGIRPVPRSCGSCNKCCEGWLHGAAYDHKFWRGRPCHYLAGKACSIYENRPENPCKSFHCEWLRNEHVPGWLKPDEVNAILVERQKDGFSYLEINEAGEKLRAEVLSWAVMYCLENNLNLVYFINGGLNRIGSKAFLELPLS